MQSASDIASDVISSLSCFFSRPDVSLEEQNNAEFKGEIAEQFVHSVDEFSSQYGSQGSVSYTAFNLRGPPSNFPDYGDYPQAFVMRTYGAWWDEAPSAQRDYAPNNKPAIPSQDFVEVSFEHLMIPVSVNIFETYNPGAIVRVWARAAGAWALLWEGAPEFVGHTPRIFSPPIRPARFPTQVLRLEFNHSKLAYYTELDAILLRGYPQRCTKLNNSFYSLFQPRRTTQGPGVNIQKGEILNRLKMSNLNESAAISRRTSESEPRAPVNQHKNLQSLPDETMLYILQLLDVRSLCRVARVSWQLRRLACDAMPYRRLCLRPYWHCLNSQALATLATRCKYLQKLDLSWCGSHGAITSHAFVHFIEECGADLTHLRLNSCSFVDSEVLSTIVLTSPLLEEMCLRSCSGNVDFSPLARLTKLRRLDMYRTDIDTAAAVAVVRSNPQLQHVNFGACCKIASMDEVALALGAHCRELLSVDFWKSYTLTPAGIRALAQCTALQELDVGWCLQASGSGGWLAWLAGGALRKLFLGALRGVSDADLRALVLRAPHLQQLDLLGVRSITPHICCLILSECPELRLLDLSFCDQITESQVAAWRERYPRVSIKRSFQTSNHNRLAPLMQIL